MGVIFLWGLRGNALVCNSIPSSEDYVWSAINRWQLKDFVMQRYTQFVCSLEQDTKAISLLHRLHIIHIVVSTKCPGFCTETRDTTIGNSGAGIKKFLSGLQEFQRLLFCTIFQTFSMLNHPFTIPHLLRHLLQNVRFWWERLPTIEKPVLSSRHPLKFMKLWSEILPILAFCAAYFCDGNL